MTVLSQISTRISDIGLEPSDDEDLALQKTLQVRATLMMATFAIFWGAVYWHFEEHLAALIPLAYSVLSFASVAFFAVTKRYPLFRFSQLACYLLLPFFLMIALGGFINSSGVVLWSLTAPLGALLFADRRQARDWFLAFLFLVLLGAVYETMSTDTGNNLPTFMIRGFFVLNICMCSVVIFAMTTFFVRGKAEALDQVKVERARSDGLLANILPDAIARRLKEYDRPIADRLENVTILFADIVGFTEFANTRPPEEVVDVLNSVFSKFDDMADQHGLEKIKTIGDAYMVAGGLPEPGRDHAAAVADFGLDVLQFLENWNNTSSSKLSVRMGIHSGSVVAGVIGKRKFSYDIWGDAVNLAARLEAASSPDTILVSEAAHELLSDTHRFEEHRTLHIKGMGEQQVYVLKARA